MSALLLPVVIGMLALSADYGHGLVTKTENQRIADITAYAGALAYSTSSTSTAMTAAAQRIAGLNGIAASQVQANLVASPRNASGQAVSVNIATTDVLLLAPVLKTGTTLPVSANSYAALAGSTPACMLALSSSGTGITLTGGTNITAPACNVASNNSVSVPCGDTITAKTVTYNGAVPAQPCTGITAALKKASTADPIAASTSVYPAVTAAATHASGLSSLTSPSAPAMSSVTSGLSVSFGYSGTPALPSGCGAALSGSTWTMTCAIGGTYNFGTISLGGGQSLNIVTTGSSTNATTYNFSGAFSFGGTVAVNTAATAAITYNFGQGIALSNGSMAFGPGTYNVAQGIVNSGGGVMSFGAGTFKVVAGITNSGSSMTFGAGTFSLGAASTSNCWAGGYSICNSSGTLTFGGPSTFVTSSGIYNNGGATLTLGSGSTNSYNIGSSSSGSNAFTAGGGSKTTFADATGSNSLFQLVGNFNVTSGGGSCVTLGAAAQHDIDGYFSTAGGTTLGTGVYSVYGYIALGANGGGDVTCNETTVGLAGINVTFVTAAKSTTSTYPCSNSAFCVGAGYGHVSLVAPTSGTNAYLGVIGPTSTSNTAGAVLTEGASNTTFSGAFYFPNGPMTLSGGASIGNQAGQCLEIIASQISLAGGTSATASACFSGSSSSNTVQLVQ